MATRVLTAHLPLGLVEKVDILAERLERSKGWIVKQALTAWVDQQEQHHAWTLEALSEVDHNQIIDHEAVQAWADSLTTKKPLKAPLL